MVWEFVFMMVILKIPIVYLGLVVYWAVKAEPRPPEHALMPAELPEPEPEPGPEPEPRTPWRPLRPRRPRAGPHGSPVRLAERSGRAELPS